MQNPNSGPVKGNDKHKRISKYPDFIIGGAAKSATTSLAFYLNGYPGISLPERELNFFAFAADSFPYSVHHNKPIADMITYLRILNQNTTANTKVLGEKSVSYLYSAYYHNVIRNIQKFHPSWSSLKFIFILRHPADRAFSQYNYNRWFQEDLDFPEALDRWPDRRKKGWVPAYDYLGAGIYSDALEAYFQNFPNVRVYLFENLTADPPSVLEDIVRFLGSVSYDPLHSFPRMRTSSLPQPGFAFETTTIYRALKKYARRTLSRWQPGRDIHTANETLPQKKHTPDPAFMQKLSTGYISEIRKLEHILQTDLSSWITKWNQ